MEKETSMNKILHQEQRIRSQLQALEAEEKDDNLQQKIEARKEQVMNH